MLTHSIVTLIRYFNNFVKHLPKTKQKFNKILENENGSNIFKGSIICFY